MHHSNRVMPELNSGAMADIAFLLLTFYMVTTEIKEYKGLSLILPDWVHRNPAPIHNRNLFAIHINSSDELMVEGNLMQSITGLKEDVKEFILNNGMNPNQSDSPKEAVISIKTDRATSYKAFIQVLDETQAAYHEIYADRIGMTTAQFRALDLSNPKNKKLYETARHGIPMNISIAEPSTSK